MSCGIWDCSHDAYSRVGVVVRARRVVEDPAGPLKFGKGAPGRVRSQAGGVIDEGEQHEERQQVAEALGVARTHADNQHASETISEATKAYTDQASTANKESPRSIRGKIQIARDARGATSYSFPRPLWSTRITG